MPIYQITNLIHKRMLEVVSIVYNNIMDMPSRIYEINSIRHKKEYNIEKFKYYKERLNKKSCYDCTNLYFTTKLKCKNKDINHTNNDNQLPEITNCNGYKPNKHLIRRNFYIIKNF